MNDIADIVYTLLLDYTSSLIRLDSEMTFLLSYSSLVFLPWKAKYFTNFITSVNGGIYNVIGCQIQLISMWIELNLIISRQDLQSMLNRLEFRKKTLSLNSMHAHSQFRSGYSDSSILNSRRICSFRLNLVISVY